MFQNRDIYGTPKRQSYINGSLSGRESHNMRYSLATLSLETLAIAVLDDDDVYRSLVSALISKNSKFVIFEASSGDELHRILDSQKIDCIVMDYNLGTESGFAVRDRLPDRYHVVPPIVMLTGDGRESTVIKALRLGFKDYLAKRDFDGGRFDIGDHSRVAAGQRAATGQGRTSASCHDIRT